MRRVCRDVARLFYRLNNYVLRVKQSVLGTQFAILSLKERSSLIKINHSYFTNENFRAIL